jgi:hypothetical protein
MKVQVRDINTWALLAEADLTGKKFTVIADRFVSDEEISMTVIATGTTMPDAFLVSDEGRVIRLVSFDGGSNVGHAHVLISRTSAHRRRAEGVRAGA